MQNVYQLAWPSTDQSEGGPPELSVLGLTSAMQQSWFHKILAPPLACMHLQGSHLIYFCKYPIPCVKHRVLHVMCYVHYF